MFFCITIFSIEIPLLIFIKILPIYGITGQNCRQVLRKSRAFSLNRPAVAG